MAIGTAAAIGLGVAGVGSILGASSANSASRRAAETSASNNAENTALAREIYGNNQQVLNPYVQRGNAAGNQLNALLGLGGSAPAQAGGQPNALTQFTGNAPYGGAGAPYGIADGIPPWSGFTGTTSPFGGGRGFNPAAYGDVYPQTSTSPGYTVNPNNDFPMNGANTGVPATTGATTGVATGATTGTTGQTAQQAAQDAFQTFREGTGYQFRLGEGLDAVGSAYAGIGGLQSGAAMRGINEYAQNFASNEFGNYAGLLSGQQAVGAGSASALAGVGQNFAGTVINSNNLNAQNQMSAQLGRQNGFANALGTIGGGILGYGL